VSGGLFRRPDGDVPRTVIVPRAMATTTRSALALLELAWPFSQVPLLTPDEFVRKANERHLRPAAAIDLDLRGLEELHRHQALVPLYRVASNGDDPSRAIHVARPSAARSTVEGVLFDAAEHGRVFDPAAEGFRPWPRQDRGTPWPRASSGYLYSRHQLIGLERTSLLVTGLCYEDAEQGLRWTLDVQLQPDPIAVSAIASWRELVIVLSALDTVYWPSITRAVRHDDEVWRSIRETFDPASMLAWLGLAIESISHQIERLLTTASFDDVLGDFYDMVRRSRPPAWDTLGGAALAGMDSRLAAEVLALFDEDLRGSKAGLPPLLQVPESRQRLSARPRSLDAALTELELSPYPALVIGVEGETEQVILPRVLDLLDIPREPHWIRIENFGGTTRDLSLLARFASAPMIGDYYDEYVLLDRPVTRFLVLTDAENKYRTGPDRTKQRRILLDSITKDIPRDVRRDLYRHSARLVEIRTWGRYPYEFAHFTPRELAAALLARSLSTSPPPPHDLARELERQKTRNCPDVTKAWRRGGVSKLALAEELWPVLEAKIRAAIRRRQRGPMIMRAALHAHEMALMSFARKVAIRRA
jgi:hypothetical protein